MLRQLDDDLWVLERPQRMFGIELGTRMTVIRLPEGLLVYSPVALDDALNDEVARLGEVRHVIAPNSFHHLYAGQWAGQLHIAPALRAKRPDLAEAAVVVDDRETPWSACCETLVFSSMPMTTEVVLLHRPSRTLVVSDLLFNIQADAPWLTRLTMAAACAYPGCRPSLLERILIRDRPLARRQLDSVLSWDFDRVILAHGAVLEHDGAEVLRDGYRWVRGS